MSHNITQDILSQAVKEVIAKLGRMNLAELERMLSLTQRLVKLAAGDSNILILRSLSHVDVFQIRQDDSFRIA